MISFSYFLNWVIYLDIQKIEIPENSTQTMKKYNDKRSIDLNNAFKGEIRMIQTML